MKIKIKLITSILSALLLTSCVDNVMSDAPDKDNPPTGTLMFHLHTYVQGMIDTTSDNSGSKIPFCYKIGTNANYLQVNMPEKPYKITKDQIFYQHIYIDYTKLFTDVQLNIASNLSIKTPLDNVSSLA